MKWKQFVKVGGDEEGGAPYYVQWGVWCWHKPVWVGLPLIWLAIPLMPVDAIYGLVILLTAWAKHR